MKKILEKDKKIRKEVKKYEKEKFIYKTISSNYNLPDLIRFNALNYLNQISSSLSSKTTISNRCVVTINKKKFNKLSNFSRIVTLKLAKKKQIHGLKKSSW
jgi:ribosomal protein S14